MEETNKKDRIRALAGTIIFHAVLLVCFLFFGLSTPLPLPEEEGVIVNLGYEVEGMGSTQPLRATPPAPESAPSTPAPSPEEIVTQSTEETVSLPDAPASPEPEPPRPESPREEPTPAPEETAEDTPEEEPQPQVDPRALFPGADQRSTDRQNQGETGDPGDQGQPDGTPDGETYDGTGRGGGVEFSLAGRSANYLPIPEYTEQAQGRVVVSITVNRQGQVTRASAGARGSTTSNQTLWRLAEDAARRARFDMKLNAPHEQTGTITYNFIRLN